MFEFAEVYQISKKMEGACKPTQDQLWHAKNDVQGVAYVVPDAVERLEIVFFQELGHEPERAHRNVRQNDH
jgi:hypothetical protein